MSRWCEVAFSKNVVIVLESGTPSTTFGYISQKAGTDSY